VSVFLVQEGDFFFFLLSYFVLVFCVKHGQINQLEKDKDVVAQSQAIAVLERLPQLSFSVVNALNNFLHDSKVNLLVLPAIFLLYFVYFCD
jgi:hypothetical protein